MIPAIRTNKPIFSLGLMSGTSMDGIDLAVILTDGKTIFDLCSAQTFQYSKSLSLQLRQLVRKQLNYNIVAPELSILERQLTEEHAKAVINYLEQNQGLQKIVKVIGFHGQTINHNPSEGISLQIGDGALLAALTGIPVVNDFRSSDIKAGGQGAPLVPIYHLALSQSEPYQLSYPALILNLGGVANITWIGPNSDLIAFDTGPGCALIDDWIFDRTGKNFDKNGDIARKGLVNKTILLSLLDDIYLKKLPPKSLDRNHFDISAINVLSTEDAAATLVAFTAECVTLGINLLPQSVREIVVSGGGRYNTTLLEEISSRSKLRVLRSEEVGWRGDFLEAEAFAYLAVRSINKDYLTLPSTTGVKVSSTGGILHQIS